jgi:phytoene dehydrogenase-like protein
MADPYDAIVIGGGHNGLVAGAYLARAGARTVVLEARPKVGGAVDTSAPFPDHPEIKVSTYSYVMSLMPAFIISDLRLEDHGYRVTPFGPYYQAFPDGRSITIYGDQPAKTHASIAQFSARDAEVLPEYEAWIHGVTEVVAPLLHQVPPTVGSMRLGDLLAQTKAVWTMRRLGSRGVADATRLFTMSLSELLDRWFESEQMKTIMMVDGLIGQWCGPDEPGSAYVLLHHAIGSVGGQSHTVNWGYPQGGMGAVADSIRGAAASFGCQIRTDARVARILVEGGRATGVALDSGEELRAPTVVSCVHPQIAFLRLLERSELPEDFVFDIERWKTRSGVVKINVAMRELPSFTADPGTAEQDHHTGSVELCLSREYAERAFQDAHLEHRAAAAPFVDGAIPTTMDRELAPDGVHVFSMFSQWVPHEWSEEPHRDELEAYADRAIDLYTELAPNFRDAVIDRQVIGPYDMEQELGLIGGNIFHGELTVDQLFHMRPSPGYADYRTPIPGLYHGSSATHAGGGVSGLPGWQAFRAARADRRGRRSSRRSG